MSFNFSTSNPDAKTSGSSRDEHFVKSDPRGSAGTFGPSKEDNKFILLPPFSNHMERFQKLSEEKKPIPLGSFYTQLRVKTFQGKFAKSYRVDAADCDLINKFRALYDELKNPDGSFSDKLKKLADHMGGFGDPRCILNVIMSSEPDQKFRVRWFDCPAENPGPDAKKRLLTKFVKVVQGYANDYGGDLIFDLEKSVVLTMNLSFSDTIPQFQSADVETYLRKSEGGYTPQIASALDLLRSHNPEWDASELDAAGIYATEFDEVPAPDQIPNLVADGQACEILGISTKGAASRSDSAKAPSEPAPKMEESSGFGFSASSESSATPSKQEASEPAQNSGNEFSSMDQHVSDAASDFAAQMDSEAAQQSSDEPSKGGF